MLSDHTIDEPVTQATGAGAILEVTGLSVHYGAVHALKGVDVSVPEGGTLGIIGANGAGKTTMMRALLGLLKPSGGEILFEGRSVTRLPTHQRVDRGIVLVPEGRGVIPRLSVVDNLRLGLDRVPRGDRHPLELAFEWFPPLDRLRSRRAGALSGGELQMLAVARALLSHPRLLLMDEPTLGLFPTMVESLRNTIGEILASLDNPMAVVIAEQNPAVAVGLCDRILVLDRGTITWSGSREELLGEEHFRDVYFGTGSTGR